MSEWRLEFFIVYMTAEERKIGHGKKASRGSELYVSAVYSLAIIKVKRDVVYNSSGTLGN
jgi:hypothetical protein